MKISDRIKEHAAWLDSIGADATDPYERGRYHGKAEGIRLVLELFDDAETEEE